MNDDMGNIPSSELVRQMKARPYTVLPDDPAVQLQYRQETELIAQELDRRCEAAGMAIVGNSVAFSHIRKGYPCYENGEEIPVDEVYHLLGWLLMN